MGDLFLIVRIAGHRVAICAGQIGAVVEVDEITPVPRVAPHVAGLFALRSRVMTVIDGNVALGEPPMARLGILSAVTVMTDGHGYALLVDEVEDVVSDNTIGPCTAVLGEAWARIVIGQLDGGGSEPSIPLIDPASLILGLEVRAA